MSDFIDLAIRCSHQTELVREYDRLSGAAFGSVIKATGLNAAIDEASGRTKDEWMKWMAFVFEFIWIRLPPECFAPPHSEGKG
jgi:hypothetical protein